jgi:hypothetical protein
LKSSSLQTPYRGGGDQIIPINLLYDLLLVFICFVEPHQEVVERLLKTLTIEQVVGRGIVDHVD